MNIYLDNAATTALDARVLDAMLPYLQSEYGNPSSIHGPGRTARLAIEESRKKVATLLDCAPAEIFFTSCGTESTNTILNGAVDSLGCSHIITSPIEHHATLFTAENIAKIKGVALLFVKHHNDGTIDLDDFQRCLSQCPQHKTLVSFMHANNEIGTINQIELIGEYCAAHGAFFHSDMVQTVGHKSISLKQTPVHFASASAHKFHGPKGTGIMYINGSVKILPYIIGGGQERNMRAGTENVAGIVGFASALAFALDDMEAENQHTAILKDYCWKQLLETFPAISLNGNLSEALPRVLNILMPLSEKAEMLQMALDIKGIAISGGSACSSGALGGSHVINHLSKKAGVPLRISFSKWNTTEDVDQLLKAMKEIME